MAQKKEASAGIIILALLFGVVGTINSGCQWLFNSQVVIDSWRGANNQGHYTLSYKARNGKVLLTDLNGEKTELRFKRIRKKIVNMF